LPPSAGALCTEEPLVAMMSVFLRFAQVKATRSVA
jgi:hypothetical protein